MVTLWFWPVNKMKRFIENLKQKPEHHRHRIAFWSAFGITVAILIIWVFTFDFSSKDQIQTESNTNQKPAISKITSQNKDSKDQTASVGSLWQDIKNAVLSPKKVIYSEVEVRPGN